MDMAAKLVAIFIGGFIALWFILIGIMMRKWDFSCLFEYPFGKKDGLYMRGILKIAEDTPENRKKASKYLGNYFIVFAVFMYIIFLIVILIK